MRKQVTLLSGLLLVAGASVAQVSNVPARKQKSATIKPSNGIESKKPVGTLKADGDLLMSDDFSVPGNWTIGTTGQGTFIIGNNSHAQMVSNASYLGNMASTSAANGFAFFNGTQYLIAGSVDPQNTTVTSSAIDLTGLSVISISFQQRYRAFNSDVTYVELSNDGGMTWPVSEVVNAAVPTNGATQQNTITLDVPVTGSANTMIRFRWENLSDDDGFGSGYGWCIDDVEVRAGYGNNITMNNSFLFVGTQQLEYTKMPEGQTTSAGTIALQAYFDNIGYNTIQVNMNATSGAYNFTSANTPNVLSFTEDSVLIDFPDGMAIPTTAGTYDLDITLNGNNPLVQTADDATTMPFEVTAYTYAADHYDGTSASIDGAFEEWSSGTGDPAIGTLFEIFESAEVGSIDVGIGNIASGSQAPYIGREFRGLIYKLNDVSGEFEYYDESDSHILASGEFGKIVKLKMINATIPVDPGLYLVMAGSFQGSPVPFAFSGTNPAATTFGLDGADVIRLASDDATPRIVDAPVVRLDFQSYVGLTEVDALSDITTAPNPFNNETTISFNVKSDSEVAIVVTDMAGRTVATVPAANYATGNHSVTIDGSSLGAGVYNATLTVGGNTLTKRIVKK